MLIQLLTGGLVSFVNFGIHAVMTGLIVIITRHIAGTTDDLHVFMRVSALLLVTVVALTVTHVSEIAVWAGFMTVAGITAPNLTAVRIRFRELHRARLWRRRCRRGLATDRAYHGAERLAADRMVRRHHL